MEGDRIIDLGRNSFLIQPLLQGIPPGSFKLKGILVKYMRGICCTSRDLEALNSRQCLIIPGGSFLAPAMLLVQMFKLDPENCGLNAVET